MGASGYQMGQWKNQALWSHRLSIFEELGWEILAEIKHIVVGQHTIKENNMTIDWAYLRKGWASCKKAQEFLEQEQITIEELLDARKNRIEVQQAWDIVKGAENISVAKGKKVVHFSQVADEKEAVLKRVMGPSGNLRAPTLRIKDQFVVGFNPEMYEEKFK